MCISYSNFSVNSLVSFIRYELPFIFTMYDLCVSRSTIAAVNIGSQKISLHLSNDKFVVIIVDFKPALNDKWVNNISAPALSNEIYPNSSHITKSYFLNLFSKTFSFFSERLSRNSVIRDGAVVKKTVYPSRQALIPSPIAI